MTSRFDPSSLSYNHKSNTNIMRRNFFKSKKQNENNNLSNLNNLFVSKKAKVRKDACCPDTTKRELPDDENVFISKCYTDLDHEEVKRSRRNKLQKTHPSISIDEDAMSDPQPSSIRVANIRAFDDAKSSANHHTFSPPIKKKSNSSDNCFKNSTVTNQLQPQYVKPTSNNNNSRNTNKHYPPLFKKNVSTLKTVADCKQTRIGLCSSSGEASSYDSVIKYLADQSLRSSVEDNSSNLFNSSPNKHSIDMSNNKKAAEGDNTLLQNTTTNNSIGANAKFSNITVKSENSDSLIVITPKPLSKSEKRELTGGEQYKLEFEKQNKIVEKLRQENIELHGQLSAIKSQYECILPKYYSLLGNNKELSLIDTVRKDLAIKNQELQNQVNKLYSLVEDTDKKKTLLEEQVKQFDIERSRMVRDAEDLKVQLENYRQHTNEFGSEYDKKLSIRKLEEENDIKLREMRNNIIELKGNIRVIARFKLELSSLQGDNVANSELYHFTGNDSVTLTHKLLENEHNFFLSTRPQRTYYFNRVFRPTCTQEEVFGEVSPYITSCIDGSNVCIMTYGQTGSGKTFTMKGSNKAPGIIPRAVQQIFTECQQRKIWKYDLYISILQIYNENITDLLTETINRVYIQDDGSTVFIKGLQEFSVKNENDIEHYIKLGRKRRSTAKTILNFDSSRSHFVVMLRVFGSSLFKKCETQGILTLCDLAGFEKFSATDPHGKQATETKYIGKSLTVLGRVFEAIRTKRRSVPFRESKLTHLLKPSLSGDAKCVLILTLSAKSENVESSVRSLQFGTKAMITNLGLPKVNICHTVEEVDYSLNLDDCSK